MKTSILFCFVLKEKTVDQPFSCGGNRKVGMKKKIVFVRIPFLQSTHSGAVTHCRMSPIVVRGDKKKTNPKRADQLALPLKREGNIKCAINRSVSISQNKTKRHPLMDVGSFLILDQGYVTHAAPLSTPQRLFFFSSFCVRARS